MMSSVSSGVKPLRAIPRIASILIASTTMPSCARSLQGPNAAEINPLITRLPAVMDSGAIPGLSFAIVSHGKIIATSTIGVKREGTSDRVTPNTVFEAASLSKPVVAYMVMRLVDSGLISLDKPLSQMLPLETHDPRANLVTARMVLSHTTGLQNERINQDTLVFAFQPGTAFSYSGEAYTYLGHVLETITHQSLPDLATRLVFTPLGMTHTSFVWEDRFGGDAATGHGVYEEPRAPGRPRIARGAATLHTTATDYAKFLNAVARGTGLSKASRAALVTPVSEAGKGVRWTLGWGLEEGPTGPALWHHGDNSSSGFTAFAWLDLATEKGIVYFANSTEGLGILRPVLAQVSPGVHPIVSGLNYESYDSPARSTRLAIYRAALSKGGEAGVQIYRKLKETSPATVSEEQLLNRLGYAFLSLNRPADAVAFFKENAKVFPASANVYDSLGDGLSAGGRNAEAIEAYRQSVRLDPSNTHAQEMIRKLLR